MVWRCWFREDCLHGGIYEELRQGARGCYSGRPGLQDWSNQRVRRWLGLAVRGGLQMSQRCLLLMVCIGCFTTRS